MRHTREHRWWLAACGVGFGLAAVAGGLVGPAVVLFILVYLVGSLLIEFEGERAPMPAAEEPVTAEEFPSERTDGSVEVEDAPASV